MWCISVFVRFKLALFNMVKIQLSLLPMLIHQWFSHSFKLICYCILLVECIIIEHFYVRYFEGSKPVQNILFHHYGDENCCILHYVGTFQGTSVMVERSLVSLSI